MARLGCLRGVGTLTAFGLTVQLGDWYRLTGATIGSYLGLVPAEYSSGERRNQGGITKTGNSHAPRLLVESGLDHRKRYRLAIRRARPRRTVADFSCPHDKRDRVSVVEIWPNMFLLQERSEDRHSGRGHNVHADRPAEPRQRVRLVSAADVAEKLVGQCVAEGV